MTIKRVNRIGLDGTTVSIAFGRVQIPCISVSYGDKLEPENISYMGSQAIDEQSEGTYSTDEAKVKMTSLAFRTELLPLLQTDGFGAERLSLVVSFSHPDLGDDSDMLDGARFTGTTLAIDNSNKVQEVEFGISFTQLYWGEERKTRNKLNTARPLGSSNF